MNVHRPIQSDVNRRGRLTSRLVGVVLVLVLASWGYRPALAGPPPWTNAPYTHYAEDQTLDQVLRDFATNFSLSLQLSSAVTGRVNARFNSRHPGEFLDQLASVYGLVWFTHAGTLHISRTTETVTKSLPASASNIGALRQALTDLRVLDSRFGWGELADQAVVLVSGPPAYIRLIEQTMEQLPQIAGGQQTAIFRLRYASAEDRTLSFRGKDYVSPGITSIMRNLMGAGGPFPDAEQTSLATSSPLRARNVQNLGALAAPMRVLNAYSSSLLEGAASASDQGMPANAPSASGVGDSAQGGGARRVARGTRVPSVQSDARINALIVQDVPERLPIWGEIIRQLDVPTALIEIEAMIIDVNSQQLHELGIAWGGRLGSGALSFGNLNQTPDSATLSLAVGSRQVTPSTLVVDTGNYLISRLRALEGLGDARIQSRPSILTVDNVSALIDLSETFYIRTTGERVATVTPITTGTSLRVTPHYIDSDGERLVQLVIEIEDGKIQDRQIDQLPTVSRSLVSTQAIVNENQTLLIGGYNTDQEVERTDRVPLLGKLPGVGALFSHRSKDVQKRERLFLIKPKLISVPPPAAAATRTR